MSTQTKETEKDKTTKKWLFEIDKELDENFRRAIGRKKGSYRGVIKNALEEAIRDWIKKKE